MGTIVHLEHAIYKQMFKCHDADADHGSQLHRHRFQRGTHANWQLLTKDATGAPTPTDMGASFVIAAGGVLTHYIAAAPNDASAWVRLVNEVTGAVFEQEITVDLPATSQFLCPRLYMNNGVTATAVAYDCSGVYVETDY